MASTRSTARPDFVGPDWLRCTHGMSFASPPPDALRRDEALRSENPWERLVCVTLQAQAGDFRNVEVLLELVQSSPDSHLRDCATVVFALAAPTAVVEALVQVFEHPDHDTRLEAYGAAVLSCRLRLASALARQRARVAGFERERVMDHVSEMLEADPERVELVDSPLDDDAFVARVDALVAELAAHHGPETAIHRGEPLDARRIVDAIAALCAAEEPEYGGGTIAYLFSLLEGITGWPYAGCLDDDCVPVLPKISHTLNSLRQSGRLDRVVPGQRYFFGHPLP